MLNGYTSIALMLLDVLEGFEELKICVAYSLDGKETSELPSTREELERAVPVYRTVKGFTQEEITVDRLTLIVDRGLVDDLYHR